VEDWPRPNKAQAPLGGEGSRGVNEKVKDANIGEDLSNGNVGDRGLWGHSLKGVAVASSGLILHRGREKRGKHLGEWRKGEETTRVSDHEPAGTRRREGADISRKRGTLQQSPISEEAGKSTAG